MSGYVNDSIKIISRELRKNMTFSEEIIWKYLRKKNLGYKFLRQKPIYLYTENSGLGRYIIPDFICLELKLVLEIDGNIHDKKEVYLLDGEKEKLLNKKGFKVIRIKNEEINNNLSFTLKQIKKSFP